MVYVSVIPNKYMYVHVNQYMWSYMDTKSYLRKQKIRMIFDGEDYSFKLVVLDNLFSYLVHPVSIAQTWY